MAGRVGVAALLERSGRVLRLQRAPAELHYLALRRVQVLDVEVQMGLHGHFKCNRWKVTENPILWAYVRDLYQTPGFGDTVDFDHIKRHYYQVHSGINPTGIVPVGPELSGWLAPHFREELGGRPFGDGTPPGPVPAAEEIAAAGRP